MRDKFLSKRHRKLNAPLTSETLKKVMIKLFSKRNDFGDIDFANLYQDLQANGIITVSDFSKLMKKHRKNVRYIDRQKLDKWELQFFIRDYGKHIIDDKIRRQYWFAFPALIRITLEWEFGAEFKA